MAGYSSLAYLSKLPADALKIDQTFVRDMLTDAGDHAIVQGIIALAQTFKRKTVAEGVETWEHFQALRNLGCDLGQGYGIARPMPAPALIAWVNEWQLDKITGHDGRLLGLGSSDFILRNKGLNGNDEP